MFVLLKCFATLIGQRSVILIAHVLQAEWTSKANSKGRESSR